MSSEATPVAKPWYNKVPWWAWTAIVAALLLVGGIQNLVNSGGSDPSDDTVGVITPEIGTEVVEEIGGDGEIVGEPVAEVALPTGAELAAYVSTSLGYPNLDAACDDGVHWSCNTLGINVDSAEEVTYVIAEAHAGVEPAGIAMAVFTFITAPLDGGIASLMPELKTLTVMDGSGTVLFTKKG